MGDFDPIALEEALRPWMTDGGPCRIEYWKSRECALPLDSATRVARQAGLSLPASNYRLRVREMF